MGMLRRSAAGLIMAVAILAAGSPAQAGGCLSDAQARQAVANGEARSLSTFYGAIVATTGGRPAGARLCDGGGHYVWIVVVLTHNGQKTVTVDALSGAIQ